MRLTRLSLAAIVGLTLTLLPLQAAAATLFAGYQLQAPASVPAGTTITVPVTISNLGTETWAAAGATPVDLSYHWLDLAGKPVVWDGTRTKLTADVPPTGTQQLTESITAPATPGPYVLQIALVKEGVAWLNPSSGFNVQATPAFNATWGGVQLPALLTATTYTVNIPVANAGAVPWNATGQNLIDLSYHWTNAAGQVVVWDGVRTALAADVPAGGSTTVAAKITTPSAQDSYTLTVDLVREGVAWFASMGAVPLKVQALVSPAIYAAGYSVSATTQAVIGENRTIAVTVSNRGNVPWSATGANAVNLSYHILAPNGSVVLWDGARTSIGATDVAPGEVRNVNVAYTVPAAIGSYTLAIDTVREGVAWFSQIGSPFATVPLIVTSGFNGGYDQTTTPGLATVGASLLLSVRVSNYGARAWTAGGTNPVHLSYHILTSSGAAVIWDGERGMLPSDVAVGQSAVVQVPVALPSATGSYVIAWDLVQEGVAWFSQLGVGQLREAISVQPGVTFYGKGFGHGVGLSQYGAQGYATGAAGPALTGEQIVAHYYPGTSLTVVDSTTNPRGPMRVLLSSPSSSGSASCGSTFMNTWLVNARSAGGFSVVNEAQGNAVVGVASANVTYQIAASGSGVSVYDQSANPPALKYSGPGPVTLVPTDPNSPITVQEKNEFFHGKLQFKNDGGGNLRVVNYVSYDDYVKGVIPKEMPSGWHIEAYKAQALAARSYGFTSYVPTRDYDVRDDQVDQCYGGATVETSASIAAVAATAGKVITYNGAAIRAYFSSSSGGYTVAVGCWNHGTTCAASDPWLVAVPDPADLAVSVPTPNKHASWTVTFSSETIRQAIINYKGVDIGTLLSTDVSNQAPANVGHVVSVKFRGTSGSIEVPADVFLRTYLGLKSTMVRLSPF